MSEKILVVDDDENLIKLLNISLTKAGYAVTKASNAETAIELANKQKPDLIISDVNMPGMDGIEFCWMIREKSTIPMVPFIFLSNLKDPDSVIHGFRAGADEFLHKPVDREVLISHVSSLIKRGHKLKNMDGSPDEKVVLTGHSSEITIVEIAQLMNINKRTGVLKIDDAEIYFKNGDIIAALCNDLKNEEAVYELIKHDNHSFKFISREIDMEREINSNTMYLLMEACRINDEKKSGH